MNEKTTLEQWRAFDAISRTDSLVEAADLLGKSQSTVSYLLKQLQETLGTDLLRRQGRRTVLNDTGLRLLDQVQRFLNRIDDAEDFARLLGTGREPVLRLAVDTATPMDMVTTALQRFNVRGQGTRVELHEAVMSGVNHLLMNRDVDLAIGLMPPPGYMGDPLLDVEFRLVCAAGHPLAKLSPVTLEDCEREVQTVVRDSGPQNLDRGWRASTNIWSVSNLHAAYALIEQGLCFGRLPCHLVQAEIDADRFQYINVEHGRNFTEQLYLTRAQGLQPGEAMVDLIESIREAAALQAP